MGAVERALRSSSTRKTEHIFEPVIGMVFDSREEAKEFYNLYSWEVGFGVKYNYSRTTKSGSRGRKNDVNFEDDYRSMQEISCQKAVSENAIHQQNALMLVTFRIEFNQFLLHYRGAIVECSQVQGGARVLRR
jgi:hypothetical protein